jgi:hypothetical protein
MTFDLGKWVELGSALTAFRSSRRLVLILLARNSGGIPTELLRTIRGLRGFALLLYDLHLFFVHTTAMHLELRQSTVDLS